MITLKGLLRSSDDTSLEDVQRSAGGLDKRFDDMPH
jgi:hypothetical protein